jgi:hypothetical protein
VGQQPWGGDRKDPHLEQAFGDESWPASFAETDGGIEAVVGEIEQLGRGLDLDVEVRSRGPERCKPRRQPSAGQRLQHREPQRRAAAWTNCVALTLDELDGPTYRVEIAGTCGRQFEASVEAAKQRRPEITL